MGKWRETQEAYYGQSASSEENTGRVLPILFNTEMVQAILDGRKTVTRRVVKKSQCVLADKKEPHELGREYAPFDGMTDAEIVACTYKPPYRSGNTLYVRETWSFLPCIECMDEGPACNIEPVVHDDGDSESEGCFVYKASHPRPERVRWKPSIHMPKQSARIWLKVTDVRIERLQDITEQQAEAEGIHFYDCPDGYTWKTKTDIHNCYTNQVAAMAALWNRTLNKDQKEILGWSKNPWVWVIEFERCEKPGDGR